MRQLGIIGVAAGFACWLFAPQGWARGGAVLFLCGTVLLAVGVVLTILAKRKGA